MFIERIVGALGDKRRWRQYKARVKSLPANYRTTVEALERYLTYFAVITNGDVPMSMLGDLADLFEQATATGTPVRAVFGDADPVEFAETFFRNHSDGQWISIEREQSVSFIEREFRKEIERGINEERKRLVKAIERAEAKDVGNLMTQEPTAGRRAPRGAGTSFGDALIAHSSVPDRQGDRR